MYSHIRISCSLCITQVYYLISLIFGTTIPNILVKFFYTCFFHSVSISASLWSSLPSLLACVRTCPTHFYSCRPARLSPTFLECTFTYRKWLLTNKGIFRYTVLIRCGRGGETYTPTDTSGPSCVDAQLCGLIHIL